MNQFRIFDKLDNIKLQIQKKRRANTENGMWSAPIQFLSGQFGNNQNWGQGNNGWGQQGGWEQNQQNQFGGNMFGQGFDQLQLGVALVSNQSLWGNNLEGQDWVREQMKRQAYEIIDSNKTGSLGFGMGDLNDILQKQIIFLEPSPALKKLEQLKKEGKQFYDDRFPPNRDSLCGEYGYIQDWASIQWKKLSEILPKSSIFNDKVEPNDIKQGYLGDCYFLAGLAALAERPDRIFNLFLLRQVNSVKYYSVKMLYKGKWMTIDMDENIPVLYNKPAFSSSVGDELWVVLLEKAWAKMYTSYKRIEAGYPEQALHDLTGAPIKNILMKQAGFNKQAEWQYLLRASQKQYSMVASSRPGSDRNKSQSGIVQGHAYTFLNATTLNYNGGSQRIVQLRNPWGKGQSKGRWSDSDPNWQRVPQSQLQRIGFTNNPNDGTFFMTYDAFIDEFRALTVAQINDNASYIYKSFKDKNTEGGYFKIEVIQRGYYSLQVDKTPERSFEDRLQDQYNYPEARLELAQVVGNGCRKLESCISARRTLFKGYNLDPGVYVAYVKISFDRKFEKDFDVNLAVYAQYACDIELAPRELAVMFTGNSNVRWNPAEHQQQGSWNNLGNSTYQPGDSGWGNYNNNNNNNNGGWGGNNNNNNGGWGGNNNNGWNEPKKNDDGWGGYWGGNNNNNNNNNNWNEPKKNDDGWGGYFEKKGNDNNWGNNIQPQPQPNQPKNDDGWGGYFEKKQVNNNWGQGQHQPKKSDDGWGGYFDNNGNQNNQNNNNNGWGNQQNTNNNGWGNQHNQQNPTFGQGPNSSWGPGW